MKSPHKFVSFCVALSLALVCRSLAGTNITLWQVDTMHSGNNPNETILSPGNISSPGNFGLLFSQQMDGQTYGQPLIVSGLSVSGTTHNIVYVATEHCSVYAFDADSNLGPNASPIWHDSLLPAGTVPVPQSVVGSGDITVELGITTTPVIDTTNNTLYIVSKVQRTSDTTYHQYLYALDLTTGATKFGSPVELNPTFPGTSTDSTGGVIPFSALHEHMRSAMALYNGVVYLSYASHSDTTPYHGEIIGYDENTLQQVNGFNVTPNGMEGGIWQAGASPAIDGSGNMFVSTANGDWDQSNPSYGTDWGETMLKISTSGTFNLSYSNTLNWFTPNNYANLNGGDLDLGSGGLCLLPDQAGPHTHIMVGGGKGAVLYVVDRDNLGGMATPDNAIQEIPEPGGNWLFVTPAYYNGYIYYSGAGGNLEQRAVGYNINNTGDGSYISTSPILSTEVYNVKGDGCFITSSGTTNGVVWILNGAGVNAYNAANVSGGAIYTENSTLPGNIGTQNTKFSLPMVANGKLYYTAFDDNNNGHLLVSGLLSSGSGSPAAPTNAVATPNSSSAITVTWTDNSDNEAGFSVKRSTSAAGPFVQVGAPGANVTTYTDTGLTPNTTYYYQVVAYNSNGSSAATNVASATTFPSFQVNGLVAYWNMDETGGSTVNDVTGNGHTGTINGEAGLTTGLINNGVEFHGTGQATSNITVSNSNTLQFAANQSFTLSAWVNDSALRGSEETIIAKSRDQGNYYGIWINANNQWVFRGPGGDIVGPTALEDTWTHVAAVQDGVAGTRALYINGVAVATGSAQAADGAGDLWMAQQNVTGNFEGLPGTLDEVRLYNRALAATEITDLMSTPVAEASSVQTQGGAGTFPLVIWPTNTQIVEPREGSTQGNYSLVLNFSAPVSGITASLGLQNGGTAVGSVNSVSYDPTGQIVTVSLTGVGNIQALNLHLSNIPSGAYAPVGTADIPFNVLWGDINGNGVVDTLDYDIVTNSHTGLVNSSSYLYDVNCSGAVDAADDALVSAAIGTTLGQITDTNLALFQNAVALSTNGGNTPAMAVDNNLNSRWESTQGVDPEWIYVDLGSTCIIHGVNIDWENAAGENYEIDVAPDTSGTTWTPIQTVTGNTTAGFHDYSGFNVTGRYVRMYGTMRDSPYGYSMYEFQVMGETVASVGTIPMITGGLNASGMVGSAFNYQIEATNNPTSYTAPGLPGGLTLNPSTGAITGSPTTSGSTGVPISAINSSGTGTSTLSIVISPSGSIPAITSVGSAFGTVNAAFNYQITASNSPTSYNASNLPAGLSVNTATGVISGTATMAGGTNSTIFASNAYGSGSSSLMITINLMPPPSITGNATANGTVGYPFHYKIDATNSPTSYGATGLPAGLNVNSSTGSIGGTPSAAGVSGATISAANSSGTGSAALAINIYSPSSMPPSIANATTVATAGVAFNYQIAATNYPTSYSASGLPAGLSINRSTGLITGTATAAGTSYVTISASNSSGAGAATLTLIVSAASDVNLALQGTAYASSTNGTNIASNAIDNNTGTRWESEQGVDPQWIYVDLGTSCIIHAVDIDWETAAGENYEIDVSNDASTWTPIQTVTGNTSSGFLDYTGLNATGRYVRMYGTMRATVFGYSIWEFQVWGIPGPAPVINSGNTAAGTVGSAFGYQLGATNNPLNWSVGNLPPGLTANSAGLISGTPTGAGVTSGTVTAVNTSGTASLGLTITINAATPSAPVINSAATVSGTVGGSVSDTVTATNSPTSYNITGLPSGLVFNNQSFTGEPNFQGVSNVAYTAGNGSGSTVTTFPVVISPSTDSNLAFSGSATALSVNAGSGNVAANAIDENYGTRWESAWATDPEWIYVDLGQTDTIHSVDIDWENAAGQNYEIDVSNDASTWTPIQTVTGNSTSGPHIYAGLNATGRYVRMYGTSHVLTNYGYAIWEFQVFGGAGTPGSAPVINSPLIVTGTAGAAFNYTIGATNSPTGYGASGLPAGVTVNQNVGIVSGTPSATGTSSVVLSATNAAGAGNAIMNLTVVASPFAPVITSSNAASGFLGSPFSYQITASDTPTGYSACDLPAGLTLGSAGLISGTPTQSGTFSSTITAINSSGPGAGVSLTITIQSSPMTAWLNTWFSASDLANPAISGLTATPANDGIPNLLKYALNLDPKTVGVSGLPTGAMISESGQSYLTLTYTSVIAATDITYTVEVSSDMQTWHSGAGYTATVSVTNNPDGKTQTVVVQDLSPVSSTAKQFIHLKVTGQ